MCALRDTLSSVVCQDTPAIVSIDACATRLYARANLPCADRRLSINGGGLMVYSETYSRKRGLLEKWRPSTTIPRIVYISIFLFLRFFFFLLLYRFSDRAKYFTIFWLPGYRIRGPIMVTPEGRWNNHCMLESILIKKLLSEYIFNIRV